MSTLAAAPGRATSLLPYKATWDPLVRQEVEPDTLYLLDPDVEELLAPAEGGWVGAGQISGLTADNPPWLGGTKTSVVTGRFRDAIKSLAAGGYLYQPLAGTLPTDEFTIECWAKHDSAWASVTNGFLFRLQMEPTAYVQCYIDGGNLIANYRHEHGAASVNKTITYAGASGTGAATWKHVAITLTGGTLRLYLDGVAVGTPATGCTAPAVWASIEASNGAGFSIVGAGETAAVGLALSDLRISRTARVPATAVTLKVGNVVSVEAATATGATINQRLRGGLHGYFKYPQGDGLSATAAAAAAGAVNVIRTDKMLTATPMKAGAPDATRPTLGNSGSYSYDWQVVDRTIDYIASLGAQPYISLDSCPQILGGSVAPFSGTNLTTKIAAFSGFAREVPNDTAAFATMCADLVHHCTVTRGDDIPYWGLWNEPSANGTFWAGTKDQMFALYALVAPAVKAIDPALKVGGLDGPTPLSWITDLVAYCQTNAVALDHVSWHPYGGHPGQLQEFVALVDRAKTAAGWTGGTIEIINGEWSSCSNIGYFGSGYLPWRTRQYGINDWAAANLAAWLIEQQRLAVARSIFVTPSAELGAEFYESTQLFNQTQAWATGNVYKLWARMGATVIQSTVTAGPGIFAVASKDGTGKLWVLVSSLHYRPGDHRVVVKLPGVAAGRVVNALMVDDTHSNIYQSTSADLQTVTAAIDSSAVTVDMKARGVVLLETAA